ncbi:MAG: hypothetical protein ACTSSN_10510 [Candidatus Heimdallarchaeaceae archaeon]
MSKSEAKKALYIFLIIALGIASIIGLLAGIGLYAWTEWPEFIALIVFSALCIPGSIVGSFFLVRKYKKQS